MRDDPEALEISVDTKAKVAVGEMRVGEKPGRSEGKVEGMGPRPTCEGEVGAVGHPGSRPGR